MCIHCISWWNWLLPGASLWNPSRSTLVLFNAQAEVQNYCFLSWTELFSEWQWEILSAMTNMGVFFSSFGSSNDYIFMQFCRWLIFVLNVVQYGIIRKKTQYGIEGHTSLRHHPFPGGFISPSVRVRSRCEKRPVGQKRERAVTSWARSRWLTDYTPAK